MMVTITLYALRDATENPSPMASTSPNRFGIKQRRRVIKNPISTTNMTGFLLIYLGSSFWNAPIMELFSISFVMNFVVCCFLFDI